MSPLQDNAPGTGNNDVEKNGVVLQLGPHSMLASLEITPAYTGNAVELLELLKRNDITYGLDQHALNSGLQEVRKTRKPVKIIAARGTAPTDAVDGRVDLKFSTGGRTAVDAESERNVDFREVGTIVQARKDQLLAVLIPGKDCIMGTDVHGKAVLAEKRRALTPRLKAGHNVRSEDNQFFATTDGMVKYTGTEIQVDEEFIVRDDVDFSVGNIRFKGNVKVNGNVRPGFSIEAAGDVFIAGELNDARIVADGDVTVNHGIVGDGKAEVIAKGNVRAGFVENSRVEAGGDIRLRSHAMHATMLANDVILIDHGKGAIIGGEARSGKGIKVRIIGSESVQGTCVALGGGIEQDKNLRDIRAKLTGIQQGMHKIQMTIGEAAFKRITEDPTQLRQMIIETRRPILQKLMDDYTKLKSQAQELENTIKEQQDKIAEAQKGVIQANTMAYMGSFVSIAHLVREIKDDMPAVTFYADFKEGEIKTR